MLKSNPPILTSIKAEGGGGLTAPGKVPVKPLLPDSSSDGCEDDGDDDDPEPGAEVRALEFNSVVLQHSARVLATVSY